jgi:hypothetical protein
VGLAWAGICRFRRVSNHMNRPNSGLLVPLQLVGAPVQFIENVQRLHCLPHDCSWLLSHCHLRACSCMCQ